MKRGSDGNLLGRLSLVARLTSMLLQLGSVARMGRGGMVDCALQQTLTSDQISQQMLPLYDFDEI